MKVSSLECLAKGIARTLREDALPNARDALTRDNLGAALQLLELIAQEAIWNPQAANDALLARQQVWIRRPPMPQSIASRLAEAPAPDQTAATIDEWVLAMVPLVLTAESPESAVHAHLRTWLLDYCAATIEREARPRRSSTLAEITRNDAPSSAAVSLPTA